MNPIQTEQLDPCTDLLDDDGDLLYDVDDPDCAAPECTVDAECDDGAFCNGAEICDAGTCVAGTPPSCDDGVGCTVDICDEVNNTCDSSPDDAACPDDGRFCTGQEVCDPTNGCISTGDPCPEGTTCNEDTDTCDTLTAKKVTICHKGKNTLSVAARAVPAHLAHGDTLGPCGCVGDECDDDDGDECDGDECDDDDEDWDRRDRRDRTDSASDDQDYVRDLDALQGSLSGGCSVIPESTGRATPGSMFFMYALVAGYIGIVRRHVRRKAGARKETR